MYKNFKKSIKIKKIDDFYRRRRKLVSKLNKYYKNVKNAQIQNIYDNFHFSVQILAKNYHTFFGFERFPDFRNIHLPSWMLILPTYSQNWCISLILFVEFPTYCKN